MKIFENCYKNLYGLQNYVAKMRNIELFGPFSENVKKM